MTDGICGETPSVPGVGGGPSVRRIFLEGESGQRPDLGRLRIELLHQVLQPVAVPRQCRLQVVDLARKHRGDDLRGCGRNDLRCQSSREDTRFGQPDPGERGPVGSIVVCHEAACAPEKNRACAYNPKQVDLIDIQINSAKLHDSQSSSDIAFMFLCERSNQLMRAREKMGMLIGDRDTDSSAAKCATSLSSYRVNGTDFQYGQKITNLVDSVHFTHSHLSRFLQLADVYTLLAPTEN